MKIGINASFARKGNSGIGQVTLNFLRKLSSSQKFEFVVYLEEDVSIDLAENVQKRIFLPFWKRDDLIRKIWWEKCLLPKKVKEDKCDVFISLYQSATILPKKIEHLMIIHDLIPEIFPEYLNNCRKKKYHKLTKKAAGKADKIITISHRSEKDLIHYWHLDPGKISVTYPGIDEIYKKEVSSERNSKVMKKYNLVPGYIYSGGGLEVRKNIPALMHAYKALLEKNKNDKFVEKIPKLVISGKMMPQLAPLVSDVEKIAKDLNLTQQVVLLDFVPQKDLPALYKNARVFVYPSLYEGFGLPVLEAMSQGTPVVTSKTSSLPEVGGDSVLYCDPADTKDMTMVIKNLLANSELQVTLKERGVERAKRFSTDEFTNKILNIASSIKAS